MDRRQKKELVDSLKNCFRESTASFLINYKGLSVPQMQSLRSDLRKEEASLKVSKARLMKRALQDEQSGGMLMPLLKDQIALVFASKEAPAVAKILREFAKNHESLQILAALLENRLLDRDAVVRIASLPSRHELLAHLCGALNAPIVGMTMILKLMILRFVWTVKSIEAKKQQG